MPSVGMPAEQAARRFRVGEVPPLAEGFTDRPDTARGIVEALVPGSPLAEGQQNWLGASGKTQMAVIVAESFWRSGTVDGLVWIAAHSRTSVLSGYGQALAAASGADSSDTAESIASRFAGWLAETGQPW